MNLYKTLAFATLLLGSSVSSYALDNDTLFVTPETLSSQYTLRLSDIRLTDPSASFGAVVRRPYGVGNSRGCFVEIFSDRIEANGTVVARSFFDGLGSHDYLIVRSSSGFQLYRDNILLALLSEAANLPVTTSQRSSDAEFTVVGCLNLADGYSASVVSASSAETVDESEGEDNLSLMLSSEFRNLVSDPYLTHGFVTSGLGAGDRIFYSNAASWGGWGPDAEFIQEGAYSGGSCVKVWGQAYNNGSVTTGASLDLSISLSSGLTYLVRAMVRSEGYVGKLYIDGENGYIPIPDTEGEWRLVEGLLSCTATRRTLKINNADYDNSGTLYIDNVEVYRGYTTTNVGISTTHVPFLEIPKGRKYSSAFSRTLYMAGFENDGTSYSELDETNIDFIGAARYSRSIEGSKLYPVSFTGDLQLVTVTGSYDGNSYTDHPLFNGVDYILQRYVGPHFEYYPVDQPAASGAYLIQFVDNLEGQKVSMIMGGSSPVSVPSEGDYRLMGNPTFAQYVPEGRFLRFDESAQCFLLTQDEGIAPFEAYIETSASNPVSVIYPESLYTGFQQIISGDGTRMGIYSCEGGVVINSLDRTQVDVYELSGRKWATWEISEGANFQSLPQGFYLIAGKKVVVSN